MLSDIIFSLERVTPYFLLIVLGVILRISGLVSRDFFSGANRFAFRVALPCQLFFNIVTIEKGLGTAGPFMFYTLVLTLASFAVIWAMTEFFYRNDKALIGTLVQGAFRGNFVLLGIPLASAVLGPEAAQTAALASIVLIPAYNALSIIVLSVRGRNTEKLSAGSVLRAIMTNPLIISIICAIPAWLLGVKPPQMIQTTFGYISITATPLGLLSIGGMLNFSDTTARLRPALYATAIKNFILPIVVMLASCSLGFRDKELLVLFVFSATPVAIGSYAMASEMGGDVPLASNIVILSTFISAFVLAFGIYLLRTLALI